MSYDIKYRERALDYWEEGHSKKETAKVFKVGTTTLLAWKAHLKESGSLVPKKRRETWRKIEPERLKEYVSQHPDVYLKEIAQEFNCSVNAISLALRRLKITRKKNYPIQRSR